MKDQTNKAPASAPAPAEPRKATREEVDQAGYWDEVYQTSEAGTPGWDLGQGNPELLWQLEHAKPRITPGKVVVLGCGLGNDVELFARAGFAVTAVDFAPSAIAGVRARMEAAGLACEYVASDLFLLPGWLDGAFDYVFEYTCFCAIHPTRRREYAEVCARLLKPGGQVIGCFYHHGKPDGPPYDTTPESVRESFAGLFDMRTLIVAQHSVERRAGNELWARFYRKPG